jgi:hypothetical protein
MKKKLIVVFIFIILLYISGCGGGKKPQGLVPDTNKPSNANTIIKNTDNDIEVRTEEKNSIAVYTGEKITEESSNRVPFLAVIENMKVARPQSGLSSADIVFETLAEGGIPRFMALFQSKSAEKIGPIRSDRVYFNEIAEAFNLPFAHCGGSQAAIDEISMKNLMSLNEMANGNYYWRIKSRKMPHNLYTSSDKITQLINKKGYLKAEAPEFNLNFDNGYWENVNNKAQLITLKFSGYYTTGYEYDNATGLYVKTMDNTKVLDLNNGKALSAKNIIIQVTKIVPILGDEKKRVEVKLSGSGKGYVFSNGSFRKIEWKKVGEAAQIELVDENGQAVKLAKGNTWWEIVDGSSKLTIK